MEASSSTTGGESHSRNLPAMNLPAMNTRNTTTASPTFHSPLQTPLQTPLPTATRASSIENLQHHDQEKDDPKLVDGLLSEELMKLSFQARNDFQEEIHGVRCLAPPETPELLRQSLDLLQWELDHEIPTHLKQAYLRSQHNSHSTHTYVNTDAFRLRFLRCELFDVPKAAVRMVKFLDFALDLYGDYALRRPIQLTDFTKSELKHVRKGRYQFLPYRDRGGVAGRRVLTVFCDEEWELIPPYLRNKIMIYYTWVAGIDVDVQREGIIYLVWFDATFKVSKKPAIQAKDHETISVRAAAVQVCSPDTPLYRFRRSIMTMRIGRHNRRRLVVHLGESVELRYKLQSYGIASDQIPITYTGKIKTTYLKQWMKVRQLLEEEATGGGKRSPMYSSGSDASDSDSISLSLQGGKSEMIESPYLTDIIFRKGASLVAHPGNAALRTLVVAKARKELLQANPPEHDTTSNNSNSSMSSKKKIGRFVAEIIQELRQIGKHRVATGSGKACRFLVWDEGGWWTELFQEHDIHTRIEYIARGIRNTVIKNHKACSLFAGAANASTALSKAAQGFPPTTPTQTKTTTTTTNARMVSVTEPSQGQADPKVSHSIDSPITPLRTNGNSNTNGNGNHHPYTPTPRQISNGTSTTGSASDDLPAISPMGMTQHQHGGTSIFRYQDHSQPSQGDCFLRDIKKRKLVLTEGGEADEDEANFCEAECFGMKFNSTSN